MSHSVSDEYISALLDLGQFIFDFAHIERGTQRHVNGTPETDTDHTVMLSVTACAFAAKFYPQLDLGKVAQYAIVHDLVEVYAGDVITIDFKKVDRTAKAAAEKAAITKMEARFSTHFPWLTETIKNYEALADPEARFVKAFDKVLPGLTQKITGGQTIHENFSDPESFEASMDAITKDMQQTYARDLDHVLEARNHIIDDLVEEKYAHHGKKRKIS